MSSELARFEERHFPGREGVSAAYVAATINGSVRLRLRGADGQIVAVELSPEHALTLHQAVRTKAQRASQEVKLT